MTSISSFRPTSYSNGVASSFTATGTDLPDPAMVSLDETMLGGVTWSVSAPSVSTTGGGTTITFSATPTCGGSLGTGSLTLSVTSIVTMAIAICTQGATYS